MTRFTTIAAALAISGLAPIAEVRAQIVPPPVPSTLPAPPPPAAPPPPKIDVPEVPKMDAPPSRPKALPRQSFNDRIGECLNDSTAVGLHPGERVAYSRVCANRESLIQFR